MKRLFLFFVLCACAHIESAQQPKQGVKRPATNIESLERETKSEHAQETDQLGYLQTVRNYITSQYQQKINIALSDEIKDAGKIFGVKYFLALGANPNAKVNGISLLNYAIWYGRIDAVEQLLNAGANPNELSVALNRGHGAFKNRSMQDIVPSPTIVQMLIKAGADVNQKGELGDSLLATAAYNYLFHENPNNYRYNNNGKTYIDDSNILIILLQAGAQPDNVFLRLVNLYPDLKKIYQEYYKPMLQEIGQSMEAVSPGSTAPGIKEQSGILDIISAYAYPSEPEAEQKTDAEDNDVLMSEPETKEAANIKANNPNF